PPLGHCFGIAIGKLLWQAVIDQRLRERTPGERLWKRRELEEPHVPRNQALLTGPQRFGKRRGVRRGQNRQGGDSVGVPACRTPGLIAAPVMTDKMSLGKAGGVEKCNDIGGGRSGAIIPPPSGSGSSGVAALAGSKGAQPCRIQPACDDVKAGRLLREPVEQHNGRRIRGSGIDNLETQPGPYEMVHISPSKPEVSGWQSVAYQYPRE